jgi:Raf kinase inhibitor-like YbhB/YbcL family protein
MARLRKASRKRAAMAGRYVAAITFAAAFGAEALAFELSSPNMQPGQPIPEQFAFDGLGCRGKNISPELSWANPPKDTKSFALMVHDPDAMTGGAGIWHWVIINIPAAVRSLEQGAGTADGAKLPLGSRQVNNDYAGFINSAGWGGPCPPKGAPPHRYNFVLYSLKVETLNVPPNATASHVGFVVNQNALDKAVLTVVYGR